MRNHRTRCRGSRNPCSDPDGLNVSGQSRNDLIEVFDVFDDAIGAHLRGFDEFVMHRPDRGVELFPHALGGPASFADITSESTLETQLARGGPKDLVCESIDEFWKGEEKDAFGDDDVGRWQNDQVIHTLVTREIVYGKGDIKPLGKSVEVMAEHLGIQRVGVVEVDRVSFVHRQISKILVIRVEREDRNSIFAKVSSEVLGQS